MIKQEKTDLDAYEDLKQWCEKRELAPPTGQAFDLAIDRHAVDEYIQGYIEIRELWEYVDDMDDILRTIASRQASNRVARREAREQTTNHRARALARVFGLEARNDPRVHRFRQQHLGGRLLARNEVEDWIKQKADDDGPPTTWVKHPTDVEPNEYESTQGASEFTHQVAYYNINRRVLWQPVRREGILDHLQILSADLSARYDWTPAGATEFVLTDEAPAPHRIRWRKIEPWPWTKARRRINIEARLDATPDEVRDLYQQLRTEMIGDEKAPGSLQKKAADLAVFAAEHATDESWKQTMLAWNKTHPKQKYTDYARFTRDSRQAYKRVTGLGLKRGEQPQPYHRMKDDS